MAIFGTSSALFSTVFLAAVLLTLTHQAEPFIDLGFEMDRALSRHEGLSRKRNEAEEDDAHNWLPFIQDSHYRVAQ